MQNDDLTLLREYARNHSEAAFAAIVSRHVNLVYSVAVRTVRDPHLAEEITQAVFIVLARKAGGFDDKIVLSGWLCRTARYTAANALTIQRRRRQREQEAHMQTVVNGPESETWRQIAPLLDAAMEKLGPKDHDSLVLRFFENKNYAEVGVALGASEDAAKMRVGRALEKLHRYFNQHGISSTTAIIAGAIAGNSIQPAPVTLAKTVAAATAAKGAIASASTLTLAKGALKIMAWSKAKTAIAVGVTAAILITGATGAWIVRQNSHHREIPASEVLRRLPSATKADYFPRSSWVFAGYGDPKSAVMSLLWAIREQNAEKILGSITSNAEQQAFAGQTPLASMPGQKFIIQNACSQFTNATGFYFMNELEISQGRVAVHLYVPNDLHIEFAFLLKQAGSEWKIDDFRK